MCTFHKLQLGFLLHSYTQTHVSKCVSHSFVFPFPLFFIHLSSSFSASYFISNFDGQILCSQSPLVSVRPPAMVLFITVSSLPRAFTAQQASPSCNDQMWPGPWSQCQLRTGGQPWLLGIPHTLERVWDRVRRGREVVVMCAEGLCVCSWRGC